MPTYLLRVEGVNFGSFIEDTEKLQVMRGASLALLNAVSGLEDLLRHVPALDGTVRNWTALSVGASIGLFTFEVEDDSKAEAAAMQARSLLRGDVRAAPGELEAVLPHATFVVDWVRRDDDFRADVERAVAKNRLAQLRSPTVLVPRPIEVPKVGRNRRERNWEVVPCVADKLRPALRVRHEKGRDSATDDLVYSSASRARRKYGRTQKTQFYIDVANRVLNRLRTNGGRSSGVPDSGASVSDGELLIQTLKARSFVQDLNHLATYDEENLRYSVLNGKMAVIYLDGNGFGQLRRQCRDEDSLLAYDRTLRHLREEMLIALLIDATSKSRKESFGGDGPIRFETLRFGADEIVWIVPARVGWWTLRRFFELTDGWTMPLGAAHTPLRHGAGMVFCHYKAPISRIRRLANELADSEPKQDAYKRLNAFSYEVLETFDSIADDVAGFRMRKSPNRDPLDLVLDGASMGAIATHAKAVGELPRGKLLELVQLLRGDADSKDGGRGEIERLDRELRESKRLTASARESLDNLLRALSPPLPEREHGSPAEANHSPRAHPAAWLHLAELWDYLMPPAHTGDNDDQALEARRT